jgi:hypothetical protein
MQLVKPLAIIYITYHIGCKNYMLLILFIGYLKSLEYSTQNVKGLMSSP